MRAIWLAALQRSLAMLIEGFREQISKEYSSGEGARVISTVELGYRLDPLNRTSAGVGGKAYIVKYRKVDLHSFLIRYVYNYAFRGNEHHRLEIDLFLVVA